MPKVSKIPKEINKYAIKCGRKICNEPIEWAKGIDFRFGKITKESEFIDGIEDTVWYDFSKNPKDIFIHNHPSGGSLSLEDILKAVNNNIRKIFAFSSLGFTSIDLNTIKQSVSKEKIIYWILNAKQRFNVNRVLLSDNIPNLKKIIYEEQKDFARFSGATFSDVKWSDYAKVKNKKVLKCQK